MNLEEAKKALAEGKRLTHLYFTPEEWVQGVTKLGTTYYLFEDGCRCAPSMFWKTRYDGAWLFGWSEYVEPDNATRTV